MEIGEQRRLIILSSLVEVRKLATFCTNIMVDFFPEDIIAGIELAVVESANNIVKHAYNLEEGHPLQLAITHCGEFFELMIIDQGIAIDKSKIKAPDFQWENVEDIPEGGWGVYLIESIMDYVDYQHNGKLNILKMRKDLPDYADIDSSIFSYDKMHDLEADLLLSNSEVIESTLEDNDIALTEMAEELSYAYENLNLFYSLSRDVALISDLNTFLNNTLEKLILASTATWGVIRLKKQNNLTLIAHSENSPKEAIVEILSLEKKTLIEVEVALSLKEVVANSYLDVNCHILCIPIVGLDEFLGIILLGKDDKLDSFSSGDAKLARAMADQIAVSIENNRLYVKAMDTELAKQEIEIATNLQKKLVDQTIPKLEGINFFRKMEPAKQVGGDYLILEKIDDKTIFLIVCDAMGKGMSASYFSLLSHMAIHSLLFQNNGKDITAGELLSLVNKVMFQDFDLFGMFMTAFIGKIDLETNSLSYASAGHCPPIIYSNKGGIELLDTSDFMLGVDEDIIYNDFSIDFMPEMKLLIYSDGLTDIINSSGELFGTDSLSALCEEAFLEKDIVEACKWIYDSVIEESGGQLQDDIAMIGVERV